jgi:hypothetical protein
MYQSRRSSYDGIIDVYSDVQQRVFTFLADLQLLNTPLGCRAARLSLKLLSLTVNKFSERPEIFEVSFGFIEQVIANFSAEAVLSDREYCLLIRFAGRY